MKENNNFIMNNINNAKKKFNYERLIDSKYSPALKYLYNL